ncbi:golgin subfamily A member 5-like isoform X2 [Paramacrobiotus metropolitanus]|uniref:golgin subfamily A member 5-like isoform X2 n=1 Tax=Paramacrobiotus metropolitanus TaxID=2943436 RepID=UPI0024461766|nr:golgin subfamily A member 5-like isoform X2 [Paramacrobiotus metropolitanus]
MAWFQDLAGKAESLLNRMDQTAAETLHSGSPVGSSTQGFPSDSIGNNRTTRLSHRHSGSNVSTASDALFGGDHRSLPEEAWHTHDLESVDNPVRRTASYQDFAASRDQRKARSSPRSKQTESELMEFLNAEEQNSSAEVNSRRDSNNTQHIQGNDPHEILEKAADVQDSGSAPREAFYRENQLLKSELQGLRKESSLALARAKRAEQDMEKLLNQVSAERTKNVAENNSREADFMNALKAKDSQTAVLRVKLEQAEGECRRIQEKLNNADSELNRLNRLQVDMGSQNVQMEFTKRQISELETQLHREKEAAVSQQNQLATSIKYLENQNQELLGSVYLLEKNIASEKSAREETAKQMSLALLDCDLARQELVDYQQKAHKILQSKDELIGSLKMNSGALNDETSRLEMNEMEEEKEMLRTEIISLQSRIENVTKQLHANEIRHREDETALRSQVIRLEQALSEESNKRSAAEAGLQSRSDELRTVEDELNRKEQTFHSRMKDREEELIRLRQQFFTRSESKPSEQELESRMRILTDNLIQKQTLIETLNTEKNSMSVQMERLERRLRESSRNSANDFVLPVASGPHSEAFRTNAPSFLNEHSGDNEVSRRLKRAYSTVDRFSFRLGTFLRRYPLARVMVIVYMLLLHFWVLVVLFTYTPEMHGTEHSKR